MHQLLLDLNCKKLSIRNMKFNKNQKKFLINSMFQVGEPKRSLLFHYFSMNVKKVFNNFDLTYLGSYSRYHHGWVEQAQFFRDFFSDAAAVVVCLQVCQA